MAGGGAKSLFLAAALSCGIIGAVTGEYVAAAYVGLPVVSLGLGFGSRMAAWERCLVRHHQPIFAAGTGIGERRRMARGGGGSRRGAKVAEISMSDWMFIDAKFQGNDLSGFEMSIMAVPFGDRILPGEERTVQMTRVEDEMLVRRAFDAKEHVGHAVGSARGSASSQEFLAGVAATRLEIVSVSDGGGRGGSFTCRALGRVKVRHVKHMKPFIRGEVEQMTDAGTTEAQWKRLGEVQGRVSATFAECQDLYRTIAERTVSSRLSELEGQGFMLSMPMEDHVELLRASSKGQEGKARPPGVPVKGVPGADVLFGGPGLEEMSDAAASWLEGYSRGEGYEEGSKDGPARREMLSFLACRAGGLDNEELKSVLQEESCMSRTLIGLERLEMQRDRLRAVATLSGMG